MRNLFSREWKRFTKSETGTAVLMVLLVSVFVILMGSSVLFTSHNGYLIKLVDRAGLDAFYSSEDLINETKAYIQDFSSTALRDAYTKVMSEYSFLVLNNSGDDDDVQEAAQELFTNYFLTELNKIHVSDTGDVSTTSTTGTNFLEFKTNSDMITKYGSDAVGDFAYSTGTSLPATDPNAMTGGEYSASALGDLLGLDSTYEIKAELPDGTLSDTGYFTLEHGVAGDRLILHNVTITYITDDGYEANITTDIVIEMPDFVDTGTTSVGHYTPAYDSYAFKNAASIARYWVKFSSETVIATPGISGDLYGGSFHIYNEDATSVVNADPGIFFSHGKGRLVTSSTPTYLTDDNGNVVTGTTYGTGLNGFEVYDGATFATSADSEIWSSGINIHPSSNMILQGLSATTTIYDDIQDLGGVYVSGDITIHGGNSRVPSDVAFTGDYVGFGDGDTANTSSAIIISGDNVNFDFEFTDGGTTNKLNSLTLYGTSYLTPGIVGTVGSEYALGQSMSALPDQLAYLVPAAALTGTETPVSSNPFILPEGSTVVSGLQVNTAYALWSGKTVGDYASAEPVIIHRPTAGYGTLVYILYNFNEAVNNKTNTYQTNANNYFSDYISNNKGTFASNLEALDVIMSAISYLEGTVNTAGHIYYMTEDGIQVGGGTLNTVSADSYQQQFDNVTITLYPDVPVAPFYQRTYQWINDTSTNIATLDLSIDRYSCYGGCSRIIAGTYYACACNMVDDSGNIVNSGCGCTRVYPNYPGFGCGTRTNEHYGECYMHTFVLDGPATEVEIEDAYGVKTTYNVIEEANPFDYYFNMDAMLGWGVSDISPTTGLLRESFMGNSVGGLNKKVEFKDTAGRVQAVFVSGGMEWNDAYTVGNDLQFGGVTYPDLKVLISFGGIQVNSDFTGLIMSNVGVAANAKIISDDIGVVEAMDAWGEFTEGGITRRAQLKDFFNHTYVPESEDNPIIEAQQEDDPSINWAPGNLVYFENFDKY